MKEHSEFSYLLDLIDWSVAPDFSNKMDKTGYSCRDLLKVIFVQKVKGFVYFFNKKKSHGKFKDYKEYYRFPLEADFGVKPVSNSKPIYDKYGNPKNSMFYLDYKAHTITFLNVPIFTVVSHASAHDKNYALVLLKKVVEYLDLSGFNFLADAAYDSSDVYDYETAS